MLIFSKILNKVLSYIDDGLGFFYRKKVEFPKDIIHNDRELIEWFDEKKDSWTRKYKIKERLLNINKG